MSEVPQCPTRVLLLICRFCIQDGDFKHRRQHPDVFPVRKGNTHFGLAVGRFIRNPHGAIETITSAAFREPQSYLNGLPKWVLIGKFDFRGGVDVVGDSLVIQEREDILTNPRGH